MNECILKRHGIETKRYGWTVWALDVCTVNGRRQATWIDVTEWTSDQLYAWIGY